jgi:hypothetical protein
MLIAEGDLSFPVSGDVGERFGVCEPDSGFDVASDSSATDPFLDFDPDRPFLLLNFSSQLVLFTLKWPSGLPTVLAKYRSFSLIWLSVIDIP